MEKKMEAINYTGEPTRVVYGVDSKTEAKPYNLIFGVESLSLTFWLLVRNSEEDGKWNGNWGSTGRHGFYDQLFGV